MGHCCCYQVSLVLVLLYPVQVHPTSRVSSNKKSLISRSKVLNKLFKGSKAWIDRQSNQIRTVLRRTLGETRGQRLKSGHGNTKGKQSCLKRRKKEHKDSKKRGIRCEKRKTVVQITEVEENCPQKEMQRCRKNRKIKIKMTGGTPEVRSNKRKPRMLLRHRTS